MVFFGIFDPQEESKSIKRFNEVVSKNDTISLSSTSTFSTESLSFKSTSTLVETSSKLGAIPKFTTIISIKDCEDIVQGAAAYSGGGGGAKKWGYTFLEYASNYTNEIEIIDLIGVPNDIPVVPVACMGAPSSLTGESSKALPVLTSCAVDAYKIKTGKSMQVVCGVEVGPTNSIVPIFVSALSKSKGETCFVLDGDLQGRAVLKLNMLGPYMFKGVNMIGTFYSYVLPLGANPPVDKISIDTVQMNGNTYTVVGMKVPDSEGLDPSKTEAYLGSVIGNAAPNTCIVVCFGGLNGELLKKNSMEYTSGSYTQLCVPYSLTRSRDMGKIINNHKLDLVLDELIKQNAAFISTGEIYKFVSAGGGTRSDIACWYLRQKINAKGDLAVFFNNESVVIEIDYDKEFYPIQTTPNTIGAVVLYNYKTPDFTLLEGQFLTNDEIASYFIAAQGRYEINIPVFLFSIPALDLLLKTDSLNYIGPNNWGLKGQFDSSYPSFDNIDFIPSKYLGVNPHHTLPILLNIPILPNLNDELSKKRKRTDDDKTLKDSKESKLSE